MVSYQVDKLNKEVTRKSDAVIPLGDDVADATANDGYESTSSLSTLTLDTGGNRNMVIGTTVGDTCSEEDEHVGECSTDSSSEDSKRVLKQRKRLAILDAARRYEEALQKKRQQDGVTTRLKHGTLATIIDKAKRLYNIKNATINPSTIRSQCKRNHINPNW